MNIYDYILEKLANNKRLTDPLIKAFKYSKQVLDSSNDNIATILAKTRLSDETIKRFLKEKEEFERNKGDYIMNCREEIEMKKKLYSVEIVSYSDAEYPQQLKKIKEAPLTLYVKGNLNFDYNKSVAIVGTRKITNYAKDKVKEITSDLSNEDYCIISGLAIGTDTEAHKAALASKGKTIAVLPYINEIYPPQNKELAERILESGGALVSENCFFSKTYSKYLLTQRNRIISGLSKGVFIVEGSKESGSFSQYNHAVRQNKIIFSLRPIEKHVMDYLPRLIGGEQGNWIRDSKDALRIINKKEIKKQKTLHFL